VKAPSPQSTEKVAAQQPKVTFDEVPAKPVASSAQSLAAETGKPPVGILKRSGTDPSLLDTQKDTQPTQDPSRQDTQAWDGAPSPGHLLRMASAETVTSSATTQLLPGARSQSLLSLPSGDLEERSLDKDLLQAFEEVSLADEKDDELQAALREAEAAELQAQKAAEAVRSQRQRLAEEQAREAEKRKVEAEVAARLAEEQKALEAEKRKVEAEVAARLAEEQKAREAEKQKREAEVAARLAEETKAREAEELKAASVRKLVQAAAEQQAREKAEEQARRQAMAEKQKREAEEQERKAEEQKAALTSEERIRAEVMARLAVEREAREAGERKRLETEVAARLAEEEREQEARKRKRMEDEAVARLAAEAEEHKHKEAEEQKARLQQEHRERKLQEAKDRKAMAQKLREVQEQAMKDELAKIRAEEAAAKQTTATAISPADVSAAASALKPAEVVPKAPKAKDADCELPQLSEEEVVKYKGWWNRLRSDDGSEAAAVTATQVPAAAAESAAPPQVAVAEAKALESAPATEAPTPAVTPELQAMIEKLAREMLQSMNPTLPSPPPPKPIKEEPVASTPPQAVQPVAAAPAPPVLSPAPSSATPIPAKASMPTSLNPNRINSSTHPAEYKEFGRFCESNPAANELKSAYAKGGAFRMQAFAKFVKAGCNGLALEAVLRYKKQSEELQEDEGHYYPYSEIVEFFKDTEKAEAFCRTSTCRNNPGIKTYLFYQRERRCVSTRGLDEISVSLGADPSFAMELMESIKGNDPNNAGCAHHVPPSRSNSGADLPAPPPKPDPAAEVPKKKGSELELELLPDTDIKAFISTWVTALEALESQEKLIEMIVDAKTGMGEKRKALQSLGPNPDPKAVQLILTQATPFVIAYKKHVKVATNLISSQKKESQPKKKAKDMGIPKRRARKRNASAKRRQFLRMVAGTVASLKISFKLGFDVQNHPVQSWDDESRSRAFAITVHGDEGQVMKSDVMHINSDGDNVSLQHLQQSLVDSLSLCADKNNCLGFTLHIVSGKGDWKWRKDWLKQTRFYGNAAGRDGLCQRCLASKDSWLDPLLERFNNATDIQNARATAVGNIPLKNLAGWQPEMEVPDLLHCCWLGCARDLNGSLCLLMASKFYDGATFDERFAELRKDMQLWCQNNNLRPSTIDDISTLPRIA
ncbi:unnamed protein product, partial [Symbiodinium microadriaticum]